MESRPSTLLLVKEKSRDSFPPSIFLTVNLLSVLSFSAFYEESFSRRCVSVKGLLSLQDYLKEKHHLGPVWNLEILLSMSGCFWGIFWLDMGGNVYIQTFSFLS